MGTPINFMSMISSLPGAIDSYYLSRKKTHLKPEYMFCYAFSQISHFPSKLKLTRLRLNLYGTAVNQPTRHPLLRRQQDHRLHLRRQRPTEQHQQIHMMCQSVEDPINRLKLVKRQMYGRISFALLPARLLYLSKNLHLTC